MASSSTKQGKFDVRQVIEQLDADDSDFGPEIDSETDDNSDGDQFIPGDDDSDGDNTSSDDDVPLSQTAQPQTKNRAAKTHRWLKKDFQRPNVNFRGKRVESYHDAETDTPLVYFRSFITHDMLAHCRTHKSVQCPKAW